MKSTIHIYADCTRHPSANQRHQRQNLCRSFNGVVERMYTPICMSLDGFLWSQRAHNVSYNSRQAPFEAYHPLSTLRGR